jgi:predicted Rossmann fold nucleotide-binding protein DprA/Smf involved in DNA uptake
MSILSRPGIALVGSRDIRPENRRFAEEVGRQAALQGYVLVSGNARGSDRVAQDACLSAGGKVISVVADELEKQPIKESVLYLSEEGFDSAFTSPRALSRNRVIHALGEKTFVAQCRLAQGGTWSGTVQNLRHGWSQVLCFRDGSEAVDQLVQLGATAVGIEDLADLRALRNESLRLF